MGNLCGRCCASDHDKNPQNKAKRTQKIAKPICQKHRDRGFCSDGATSDLLQGKT